MALLAKQPTKCPIMASAETIAKALGGRKAGGCWMACCPAHDDREPSLSVSAGGEGIETCLAAMQATDRPAWAALSTPASVRSISTAIDADPLAI